ncbi:MAG: ATP-binding protein [Alphaproteobacteria bacterium]|nr:ATP-binding protein [Alphaproteobacteria bacterium]MCY4320379.1 ATP-binding protein [Alphaproteobacteria bacterium]
MNSLATDILDSLPDPVLLLDAGRIVTRINSAACAVLGDFALGRDLSHSLRHPDALRAVDAALQDGGSHKVTVGLPVPIARTFDLQAQAASGTQDGALVLMRDVTAVRQNERMRADFVSNVSHELRSPLATLIGFIETLRGPAANDPEARMRFLEIMDAEAARMSRLVDDLLSLARVEAREHIRPDTALDLAPLLKGVAQTLAVRSDIPVDLDIEDGLPPVFGEQDEVTQVFENLLDNAIKYGGTGIRLEAAAVPRIPDIGLPGARIAVIDAGPGIEIADLPRLTERFYRADKARSRRLGGTGLGLAIVKHIVNRHRGRLVATSTVGQGSRFTVFLPFADAPDAA